jgi:DNA-binding transcriptional regulator YiaG
MKALIDGKIYDTEQATFVSPAELKAAGEALYGSQWQSDLSREIGKNLRTVQKWAAGDLRPPPILADMIIALLRRRGGDCLSLAATFEQQELT